MRGKVAEELLLGENISMALAAIRANKMRSFLTMLGIIIGIGSVIAIQTVGNSVTTSFASTMTNMGASNISVGVTQRETEKVKGDESGLEFEGYRIIRTPEESDFIKDNMIADFLNNFSDEIEYIILSESLGTGKITEIKNSATVAVTGGDEGYFKGQNLTLLAGREIGDKAIKGGKAVCLISDYAVRKLYNTED